ncbi:MAG: glycosyltransferase [Candidatus Hydrogenedentes bacterium]|nr:glycosyltransferase [Candidatus Hydrogenedentota bacterium]
MEAGSVRLRVCLLAEANPKSWWVPYYVDAFRERCDVVTVGTSPDAAPPQTEAERLLAQMVAPNDIELDQPSAECLAARLSAGWHPHLVVAVQSSGIVLHGIERLACPTAYITVDTWHEPNEYLAAPHYDFVFVAQRSFIPLLRATGSRRVSWLPLACSPKFHHPVPAEPDYDVVFVGSLDQAIYAQRIRRLEALGDRFSVATLKTFFREEMCAVTCRGRLVFNSSVFEDINMRVFEALAMGRPLLTNADAATNGLLELFSDGVHLITYTDDTLVEKAQQYLDDPEAREAVARAGRAEVLARHTYAHRVDTLIEAIRAACPALDTAPASVLREGASPADRLPAAPGAVVDLEGALANPPAANSVDTVVLPDPGGLPVPLGEAVRAAHSWLTEGGAFVAQLDLQHLEREGVDASLGAWVAWFRQLDFHLLDLSESGQGAYAVTARKRTKPLLDVCRALYARHPMEGVTDAVLCALIAPDR